jgi:hypothetical protein
MPFHSRGAVVNRGCALVGICLSVTACAGSDVTSPSVATANAVASSATSPVYSVVGAVTDQQSGRGIASAQVRVTDGADANKTAVSDNSGVYLLAGLPPGEVSLSVTAAGYAPSTRKVMVQADTHVNFAMQLALRTIAGTVTDATSHGVLPNVLVAVANGVSAGMSTRTDSAGTYTLAGVSADATRLQASANGYETAEYVVPGSDNVLVNIVLARLPPPPTPSPIADAGNVVITFAGGAGAMTTFVQSGFTISATSASWFFSSYGVPGPSAQFSTDAGITTQGEVMISAGGTRFQFKSVDLYSSTTRIPYTFAGFAGSATVFAVSGEQGNTFGNFVTVPNAQASASIDALLIRLTNPAAPCCSNPMGLDNIVIKR